MMQPVDLNTLESLLRAVAEPTRLRLLNLCASGEHTVSDLMAAVSQSQSRVSRHLKILCDDGLLERFRDGHWVYFRVPFDGGPAQFAQLILELVEADDDVLRRDREALAAHIGQQVQTEVPRPGQRQFNRIVIEHFLSTPVGELLDIGVGSGAVLKLLSGKATQATGIDIDRQSRWQARRDFALAELSNCTVRAGDMYSLEFNDACFDTVVLDGVLLGAERPARALAEALRVLRPHGHLLIVEHQPYGEAELASGALRGLLATLPLQVGPLRLANDGDWRYLVTMATPALAAVAANNNE